MDNITINGRLMSDMGVTLLAGGYAELLQPAPMKEMVSNDDATKHGAEVLTVKADGSSAMLIDKRDVTLTFLIKGDNKTDFLSKYQAFTALLQGGLITLTIPDLASSYRLIYMNSTQYDNYLLNACKLAVKFQEPNPTNRG